MYFLESIPTQVTGNIDKVVTKVFTNVAAANTTSHNLQEGDTVKIEVIPNLDVGVGSTIPVS